MSRPKHPSHPTSDAAKPAGTVATADANESASCLRVKLLTPRQVSELAQISYHAVLRSINDGELAASRLRGRLRVRRVDFDAWVDGSRVTPVKTARPQSAETPPWRSTPDPAAGGLDVLTAIEGEAS